MWLFIRGYCSSSDGANPVPQADPHVDLYQVYHVSSDSITNTFSTHCSSQGSLLACQAASYVVMAVVDGFSMMMAILLGFRYNLDDLEMRWLALPFYILLLESCCLISPCFAGFMSVESSSMVNLS